MTSRGVFVMPELSGYGAVQRMRRLAEHMEASGEIERLVCNGDNFGLMRKSKLFRVLRFLLGKRRSLYTARYIVVFGELELLALRIVNKALLEKVVYLQREDNAVKYKYQRLPIGGFNSMLKCEFYRQLQTKLIPRVRKVIVQTDGHLKRMEKRCALAQGHAIVIPNDIPERFRNPAKRKKSAARWGVICGSGPVRKGLDLIFGDANQKLNISLMVSRQYWPDVKRLLNADLIEHLEICFDGDAREFLKSVDALLVPSRYDECPNVVLEAMGLCVPIICSDIEAHRNILGEDYMGFANFERDELSSILNAYSGSDMRNLRAQLYRRRSMFLFDWEAAMRQGITEATR